MPGGPGSSALKSRGVDRNAPPTVKSATPKPVDPTAGQIRIEAGPKPAAGTAAGKSEVTPEQYWLEYYKTHDDRTKSQSASEALREKLASLNVNKKFRDVRAILL